MGRLVAFWWPVRLKKDREREKGKYSENERDEAKAAVRLGLKEVRTWTVSFQRWFQSRVCVCRPADTRGGLSFLSRKTAGLLRSNTCTASWTHWSRRAEWARSLFSSENKKLRPAHRSLLSTTNRTTKKLFIAKSDSLFSSVGTNDL